MYFDRKVQGGRAFMEFERDGERVVLKRRGFASRYVTKGLQVAPQWQATETPLIHDGSQNTLSTAQDARNSTNTGTTLAGPSGSGQFLAVTLSTTNVARTVQFASTLAGANFATAGNQFYGILQNKPRGGEAADVGIFGLSKVVCGSTSVLAGTFLMMSSTLSGVLVPWSSGSGQKVGFALEPCLSASPPQVITAFITNASMGSS